MNNPIAFTILLSFIFCFSSQAKSLDETALEILLKSPAFQAENYSLESASKNLKTESNLPDPEISGEYLVLPKDVDNRWAAQLEWGVEWPGVYGARSKQANKKLDAAQKAVRAERAQRLAEIKDLLLDYIRTTRKLSLLDELTKNNDTIYQLAERAVKDKEISVLDLNKIKLEYANIRVAKAALLDEHGQIVSDISQIYGKDCTELLNDMDSDFPEIVIPTESEIASIKDKAPAIQAARAEAAATLETRNVAKMEALPNLSLGYKHAFEDGMHFNGAVFGISIPLFSSRGKQKAAKADIVEAEYNVEAKSMEIESEAMATLKRLKTLTSQIQEIAPIVENVDYNATLLKAYKSGLISIIEYLSDRNYFTNAAIELVTLRHNAAKTLAFLQRYVASDLPE